MKTIRNWILLLLAFWGVNAQAGTKPTINCSRSGESVIVTWGCSDSTLDHYVLYCTGNPAGGYTKSMGLATSYTDSQADSTTTWTYWVEAWFTDGTTEQSATVSTSGGGGGGGGGFPITASDGESTEEVYITWEAVSGAASYRVIRGTSSNRSKATILGMVPATDSFMEYIDTPPVAGTVYYYWIMAQDSSNTGFLTSSYDTGYRSDSSGGGGGGGGGNGMHTETVGGIEWTYVISNNTAWVGGGYVGQIGLGSTYPAVPAETSGSLTIPSRLGGYPVVGISKYAFYSTSMTSVSIPDSVTDISKYAFVYCRNLASVSIGSGATNIPGVAFYHESTPASFTVASGNPAYASRNGMLLSKNGKKLVRGVDQTTVAVPDGVTHIVDYAFHECSGLTSIEMPDSVTYIGSCAFADCSGLTSVTIGNGVTSIGVNAFRRCSGLSSLVMPNSVRSIGAYAFADCTGMTSITLGNGLTFIGQSAFWNCPMLTSVTIPDRVTTIGNWAFDDCSQLATISIPPWLEDEKDNWSLPGRCQVIVRSVSTIKFNSAGGSSVSSITATIGSDLTAPTPPTKADYVFVGWSPAFPATMPRYGATLTAQWALAIRTVTLDRQGGSGGTASVIAAYGEALPSIAVPTRTGYTFDGYYTAANGGGTQYYTAAGAGVRNWNEASATTLYAKWTGKPSTVTFDPQGGSGGSTSATAVYGSAMPSITLPTRTGYAFGGYYTAKNGGGTQYYKASGASARNWDKTAATTLYAKWTAKTYTLTFDANGGTHSSSAQTATATYDGALPDCVPAPTNDDWAFSGWASDQAGTSLWYGPDGTKLLSSYTTAADTTLYAVWKPATPVIVPADGTILSGSQSVVISCATAGATIHFTTNGAVPTAESPTYRRFRVSQRMTVKAVAVKNGIFSAVAVAEYALGRCADPVITPADGTAFWHSGLSVSIAWSGEDGVLRYTLDGSEPAKTSPVYRGAFTIDETTVVKARAFGDQFFDSAVVTATLTRGWRSVATPVVRAAASFTGSRTPVEIDCATPGAKIRFTTDGSTPDSRSPRYAGRFHVADSCTVKAYAVLEDYDDSAVASFAIEKIRGIGDTMGDPDRTFATGGNLPFVRVADSSAPSGESMKSGAITHDGTSTLSTTVDGPGTFSFRWKTSCEDSGGYYEWDHAEFRVDGLLAAQLEGETDWRTFSRAVSGAGPHVLEWRYVKDDINSEEQDCCWVADFSWTPSCTETTEVPVPHGWLLGFYPDTPDKRDSYEAAAKASAANGKNKVWECYVAGTSPTDASDQFLAEIVMDENGNPRVIWTPDLGGARDYVVEGKASLADDWGAPDADSRFFRVHVAIPGGFGEQTITFDSAGGSAVAPITAAYGATLIEPQAPTKSGYTFAGWSPAFPDTMPFGGATLVAQWTATLSTALNPALDFSTGGDAEWFAESDDTHDGEWAVRSGSVGAEQTSWIETTVTGPGTLTFWWKSVNEYADFDWYVSAMDQLEFRLDGQQEASLDCFDSGQPWRQETVSVSGDGNHVLRWVFRKTASEAPGPFCGWLDEVVWIPTSQYTITFDSAGGSAVAPITAYCGSALTAPVAPTRNGYWFAGWSPAFPSTMPVGGATLTAQWTPRTSTVSFDAQGGSGGTSSATATYGSAMPTITVPTRMGYDFGGYWTEVNGGGTQYYTASGSSARNWDKTVATTLYAKWTGRTYSSTYIVVDLSGGASASGYPVSEMSAPPSGGWTDEYKTTKLVLRKIPAGSFTMGSPSGEIGRSDSYETQHQVTISSPFYVGVFEVTQRQYELVMGSKPSYFSNSSYYATRPVEQVSFDDIRGSSSGALWPSSGAVDATSFMGKIRTKTGIETFDLPTEARWEYACRAGTTTALNSGKNLTSTYSDPDLDEVGRNYSNGFKNGSSSSCDTNGGTAKVGSYLPNSWGLYDMHGNVQEWCLDWWQSNLGTLAATDPPGAASGSSRAYRGGSWNTNPNECRSASRSKTTPSVRNAAIGFRICCSSSQ